MTELVVVDLTRRSGIDSAAIGELLRTERRIRARGDMVRIVASHPEVVRRLRLVGIDRHAELTVGVAQEAET